MVVALADEFQKAIGQIATAMETMAEQKKEITELREHVSDLHELQLQRQFNASYLQVKKRRRRFFK